MGPGDSNLTMGFFLAQELANINVSTSAALKLALVPASVYNWEIKSSYLNVWAKFFRIERRSDGGPSPQTEQGAFFAKKRTNIDVSRSAAPKQALVPASRYDCSVQ